MTSPVRQLLSVSGMRTVARVGKRRPEWWMRNVLGVNPWSAQIKMVESVQRHAYTAIASCNSAGKTTGSARLVTWYAPNHPRSATLITAPTARQVRFGLFKELRIAHRNARVPLGGYPITQHWKLPSRARGDAAGDQGKGQRFDGADDWFVLGFTTSEHNPDSLAGIHAEEMLVVVDEAGGIPESQFEAIDGLVSSGDAHVMCIGNPLLVGTSFHRQFGNSQVNSWRISAWDTPNFVAFGIGPDDIESGEWKEKQGDSPLPYPALIRPSWVAMMAEKWGLDHPFYTARVHAEFPDNRPDQLITQKLLAKGYRLDARKDLRPPAPIMGVDVARQGNDKSAIYVKRGRILRKVATLKVDDLMVVTGYVIRYARQEGCSQVFIDMDGLGAGVLDRCREVDPPGIEFSGINFGSKAWHSDDYFNKKAEIYWKFRELLDKDEIDLDPKDKELERQALEIRWGPASTGKLKIKIESKDETKERLDGNSPDEFDAACLTLCGDIEPALVSR